MHQQEGPTTNHEGAPVEILADKKAQMPSTRRVLIDFIRSFLFPAIVGKIAILYFGIHYALYPGEGYGYGLLGSILFTLTSLGLFIWKYRNYEDI